MRLLFCFLVASFGWSQTGMMRVQRRASGGGATYTNEAITGAIATAGPLAVEGNATTGWANNGASTFTTAGTPYSGTYALNVVSTTDGSSIEYDLPALTNNQLYRLQVALRHNGSGGDWLCGLGYTTAGRGITWALTSSNTTYSVKEKLFRWNGDDSSMFCFENSDTNDGGIFVDSFSVTEAAPITGIELHTSGNAASLTNETNSVTGWVAINSLNSLTSSVAAVADGSYALKADANTSPTADNGFNIDLSAAPFSLTTGQDYLVLFKVRHIGAGDSWRCGFSNDPASGASGGRPYVNIGAVNTSYFGAGWDVTYGSLYRYFVCSSVGGSSNGGIYLDSFSVKHIDSR